MTSEDVKQERRRTALIVVLVVLVVAICAALLVPTWQVRNGAAEVANDVIDSGAFDGYDATVTWNCDGHVANVRLPDGVTHREYSSTLGEHLVDNGYSKYGSYLFHRPRTDSLDFDEVVIVQPDSHDATTAQVLMTVFDTDSTVCIPSFLARSVGEDSSARD